MIIHRHHPKIQQHASHLKNKTLLISSKGKKGELSEVQP